MRLPAAILPLTALLLAAALCAPSACARSLIDGGGLVSRALLQEASGDASAGPGGDNTRAMVVPDGYRLVGQMVYRVFGTGVVSQQQQVQDGINRFFNLNLQPTLNGTVLVLGNFTVHPSTTLGVESLESIDQQVLQWMPPASQQQLNPYPLSLLPPDSTISALNQHLRETAAGGSINSVLKLYGQSDVPAAAQPALDVGNTTSLARVRTTLLFDSLNNMTLVVNPPAYDVMTTILLGVGTTGSSGYSLYGVNITRWEVAPQAVINRYNAFPGIASSAQNLSSNAVAAEVQLLASGQGFNASAFWSQVVPNLPTATAHGDIMVVGRLLAANVTSVYLNNTIGATVQNPKLTVNPFGGLGPYSGSEVSSGGGGGSSAHVGTIAAVAILAILAVVAVAFALCFWSRRRRRWRQRREESETAKLQSAYKAPVHQNLRRPHAGKLKVAPVAISKALSSGSSSSSSEKDRMPIGGGFEANKTGSLGSDGSSEISGRGSGGSSPPTVPAANPASSVLVTMDRSSVTFDLDEEGTRILLGRGAFGMVYLGTRAGGQKVAVKVLNAAARSPAMLARLRREVAILQRVSFDRHVVQFYGAVLDDSHEPFLCMAYMQIPARYSRNTAQGGNLRHLLSDPERQQGLLWKAGGCRIALDIARGLHFLHSSGILHRDLKSSNILLSAGGRAAVSDVGLARTLLTIAGEGAAGTIAGTFAYIAPEVLVGAIKAGDQESAAKADCYAMGVIIWELVTGEIPVRAGMRGIRVPEECCEATAALIEACVSPCIAGRPSSAQLVLALEALQDPKP